MTIQPSNDRDWQPDVARLLTAEFDPDEPSRVVLRNVRNFDWQTPTEATERWETREYDLDAIESLDFILTWWAGPAIAHTMVSFGFSDGEHIVFSLGIRPELGEAFSSVAGFFKNYELILTGADERDAVRLRTSVQTGNRVVLYRVAGRPEMMRELFVGYLDLANELAAQPRFYRTILDNCTTVVWKLADRQSSHSFAPSERPERADLELSMFKRRRLFRRRGARQKVRRWQRGVHRRRGRRGQVQALPPR
jgi:hypothetical protein